MSWEIVDVSEAGIDSTIPAPPNPWPALLSYAEYMAEWGWLERTLHAALEENHPVVEEEVHPPAASEAFRSSAGEPRGPAEGAEDDAPARGRSDAEDEEGA